MILDQVQREGVAHWDDTGLSEDTAPGTKKSLSLG